MKKKLFISAVSLILLVVITVTSLPLVPTMQSIDWRGMKDHFIKEVQKFTLRVDALEGGTVSETKDTYKKGDVVDLVATPNEGYIFTGWYTEDDTYLTTSKNYSFTMEKDTVLVAGFAPLPEDMEGTYQYFEQLKNCSSDFSFTVQCDREDAESYLINNLTIVDSSILGTDWVEYEKNEFTVERVGETNEYKISLADGQSYDPGINYTAYLPETEEGEPEATFADSSNPSGELNFTIDQEETEIFDYNDDIVYLFDSNVPSTDQVVQVVDDGLAEGDEGDVADYVILSAASGIAVDTVFCVYYAKDENGKPVVDENAFFAKALSVEAQSGGRVKVVYTLPDLVEIFDELDIYTSGDVNLEEQGIEITEETMEQIKYMVLCNEEFQTYVANVFEASEKALIGTEYDVEQIAKINIEDFFEFEIKPKVRGNTATIDIKVSGKVPIKKGGKQVAAITFSMNLKKEITVSNGASLKIKYKWWVIPVGVSSYDFWGGVKESESISFALAATYDSGADDKLKDLEKNVDEELSKIKKGQSLYVTKVKEAMKNGGYEPQSDFSLTLFSVKFYAGIVSFNFDVQCYLKFDTGVTVKYTANSYQDVRVGIRSGSLYKTVSGSASSSDWMIAGKLDIRAGLRVDFYVGVTGLSKYIKAGVTFEAGGYFVIAGVANPNRGQWAAKMERGAYIKIEAYYKVFSLSNSWNLAEQRWSTFSFGFDEAIVGYTNTSLNNSTLALTNKETSLFDLPMMRVNVLDVEEVDMSIKCLSLKSSQYTIDVQVKGGQWLSYDKNTGKLIVKSGAPLYFKDQITVKVTPKYKSWSVFTQGKTCVSLPTITLNIEYGDEDAYYDAYYASIDNAMEKEFRKVYRSYSDGNAQILKNNFRHLINNALTVPEEYADVFEHLSVEYINQLFDTIKEYRKHEDKNRTMENKLVYEEANTFKAMLTYMNTLIDKKPVTEEETQALLEDALNTTALYNAIIEVAESEDSAKVAKSFSYVDAETKAKVNEGIDKFVRDQQGGANAAKADRLGNAFKNLLGFHE